MARRVIERGNLHFQDDNGTPYPAGTLLFVYEAESVGTKKVSYTTKTGSGENANPMLLLDGGNAPDAWIDGTYKLVLAPANDTDPPASAVDTWDNLGPASTTGGEATPANVIINGSFESDTGTATIPSDFTLTPGTSNTITKDDTDSVHGASSLKTVIASANTAVTETEAFYEVMADEDTEYLWALKCSSAAANVIVRVVYYDRAQSFISNDDIYSDSATNPTAWTHQHAVSTPPALAAYAKLQIRIAATGTTTRVDNLRSFDIDAVINSDLTYTGDNIHTGSETFSGVMTTQDIIDDGTGVEIGTAVSQGAGTINVENGIYDNAVQIYAPSLITGYYEGQNITIHDDAADTSGLDIDSVIGGTFESVGPTDSGATNIWTALDIVPATAIAVILRFYSYDNAYGVVTTMRVTSIIDARRTGSIASAGNVTAVLRNRATGRTDSASSSFGIDAENSNDVAVPIDVNLRFDLQYASTGTSVSGTPTYQHFSNVYLVGWIE